MGMLTSLLSQERENWYVSSLLCDVVHVHLGFGGGGGGFRV